MVVYCPRTGSGFEALAEDIAAARGERVVVDRSAIDESTVVYVSSPLDLSAEELLPLQRRLAEDGPEGGGFSVVTGRTPDAARSLYFDRNADRDHHQLLLRDDTDDWFCSDDDCEVLTGSDASVERLRERRDDLCSVSVHSHGRPIHLYLSDGYLCGFPESGTVPEADAPQPYCVVDDERQCPLEGDLLPADELDVPHLFVDSCASMLPGNDRSGLPVHVGMGLLNGADSLIGGYRQIDSLTQLPLLHYCLLRAGYDVVQRCYLLNRAAHAYDSTALPYVPFGRPETSVDDPTASEYDVTFDDGVVELTDVSAHVVDLTLSVDADPDDHVYVRNLTDEYASAPIYYAAFEEAGRTRLLLYTWGPMEAERLAFEVSPSRTGRTRYDVLYDSLDRADRVDTLGFLDGKARGQLRDLRNRIEGITDDDHAQRYDANVYRKIDDKVDGMMENLTHVRDRVVDILDRRQSSYLSDRYREGFREVNVTADDSGCPNCPRPLFVKTMTDLPGRTRRKRGVCPQCGVVFDVPASDGEAVNPPTIRGELAGLGSSAASFEVEFENARDRPMDVVVFPWLSAEDVQVYDDRQFRPRTVETELSPGETEVAEFEFDPTAVEDNEYWLSAYVVANLDVYQGLRKVVVGETVGHARPDLREG